MTFQKRLKRVMKQREIRVAELARRLGQPYTTVREWVLFGRQPAEFGSIEKQLAALERKS
jgi:predicted transcriptional regulator